ncbi:hypothetical protein GCM10009734_65490 [Nonomuraea bangladeshensis]
MSSPEGHSGRASSDCELTPALSLGSSEHLRNAAILALTGRRRRTYTQAAKP